MAYSKTEFFSAEFLKNNSIVDVNCDNKIIVRSIIEAQDLYIRDYLGTALFNKLVNDAPAIIGNYKILMDSYIVDTLLHWSMYLLAPNQVWKWRNRAIDTESGENSTAITKDEIHYLQNQCKNKAEAYAKILVDYLCANRTLFPELDQNITSDMKKPNSNAYNVPMWLGSDKDCCNDNFFS